MKVTGIIAEFNPLHKGHQYILDKARTETGADYVIAVMSGDFTQRGAPAFCDKHLRTLMALRAGVDVVIELPVKASTSSAEYFASSGVCLLHESGIVTDMIFGSESGDINSLEKIADILISEPDSYREGLKSALKEGHSFPTARLEALLEIAPDIRDLSNIMSSPNNILAIEYLKALKRYNIPIKPHLITRLGSGYHDRVTGTLNSSAAAIRSSLLLNDDPEMIKSDLPECVYRIISENYKKLLPVFPDDLSTQMKYRLITEVYSSRDLTDYADVSKYMADRISEKNTRFKDFDDLVKSIKTKDMTYSRVSRGLLHILLDIKAPEEVLDENNSYISILGFRQEASPLIKKMHANAKVPVISRLSDAKKALHGAALQSFNDTLRASDIYNSILADKFNCEVTNELSRKALNEDGICLG